MSFFDFALYYAKQGWHILPLHHLENNHCSCGHSDCCQGGKTEKSVAKHPRLPHWQNDATVLESTLRTWWATWPRANIGVLTGAKSGILVLDIDCHREKPGFLSLQKLETELGKLPPTRIARTGSGGEHRLFRYPSGLSIANSAGWKNAPGIDWRGNGGQIVVAPSVALAGTYSWENDLPLAELPQAWIDAHIAYELSRRTKTALPTTSASSPYAHDSLTQEDHIILNQIRTAANAPKFEQLWNGQWQSLYDSQSSADLALCSIFAFWCDPDASAPDPDRIDRLFRHSKLYREKWERTDYRNRTILFAVDKEEDRRMADASLRELITGNNGKNEVSIPPPPPPIPSSIFVPPPPPSPFSWTPLDHKEVLATIRKLVRKKRCSEFPQNKLDADFIESFMAAENLVSSADIERYPAIAKYQGEAGLRRIAWVLGSNLKIPWDAIINARSRTGRVYQKFEELEKMKMIYIEAQTKKEIWEKEKLTKKQKEKIERNEKANSFYRRMPK